MSSSISRGMVTVAIEVLLLFDLTGVKEAREKGNDNMSEVVGGSTPFLHHHST